MNSKLFDHLAKTFGIAEEKLLPDATLDSLRLDLLAVIEFLFQIEDQLHIRISDQPNPPRTLDEMVLLIEPLMPENQQGQAALAA